MDHDENKSAHLRQISSSKPQLLVLSSIQENSSAKNLDKPTIKHSHVADIDSEIGVFGAEKYFSMKLDHVDSKADITKQQEKESKEDKPPPPPHHPHLTKTTSSRSRTSRNGTPSVKSASSYNSQTFLMRANNNNGDNKQRKTKEISVSFGGFRCNGPCSGVKTVNTESKNSSKGRNYDRDFVAYDARKHVDKSRNRFEAKKADYPEPKMSQIPNQRSDIAINLERKLSMLTWDAIPNQNPTKNNNNGNNSSMSSKTQEDQETGSEASSDLFEIENITNGGYEPSEASIGWSVVTGSMAEQSVISDFNVMKKVTTRSGSMVKTKPVVNEKVRSGGFMSGCKSHKAVSVIDSTKYVKETAKVDNHQEMSHHHKKLKSEIRIQDLSFL